MLKQLIKRILSRETINEIRARLSRIFGGNSIKAGSGSKVLLGNSIIRGCKIRVLGKNCHVKFGRNNTLVNCEIIIFGDDCCITIGDNNLFRDCIMWLEDSSSQIIIGNGNRFTGKVHIGIVEGTTLSIGDNCLLSSDIYITTTDSHSIIDLSTKERINPSANVSIGDHVWIGRKATIGKGVSIAEDVIIGGSSFVSRSIDQSHVIAAGVPVKIIKTGVTWDAKRI